MNHKKNKNKEANSIPDRTSVAGVNSFNPFSVGEDWANVSLFHMNSALRSSFIVEAKTGRGVTGRSEALNKQGKG